MRDQINKLGFGLGWNQIEHLIEELFLMISKVNDKGKRVSKASMCQMSRYFGVDIWLPPNF